MMTTPTRVRPTLFLLACLAACSAMGIKAMTKPVAVPSAVAADPAVRAVAAANTDFGFRLLHQLTRNHRTGNVFFSPLSISSALAMTLNGAGGQTERDMAKTLGLEGVTRDQVNHANGLLLPSLDSPDPKVQVMIASALWANHGVTLAPDFRERCRLSYDARAESLDFGSPEAVKTINGWVSQSTQGKITHLINQGDIAAATAVLTNAVYFHGKWQTPFDKAETQNAPFKMAGGKTKSVPLMRHEGSFSYAETPRLQAVSLPYGDGRMSLYVLLPKTGHSVDGLANGLDGKAWEKQAAVMRPMRLTLFLPRFKAEYEARLRGPLSALGMASAFEGGADFRPMGLNGSFIGDVIHKAMLDVDEEGTVAAAATGIIAAASAMPMSPVAVMRVDHPFFMAIRDNATGTILFEGVIRDPQ
jgi:serpin B